MFILRDHIWICPKQRKITYITENLICLARADSVLLLGVAGPLVQVGAVDDVAQHVLAPLGHFIGNGVGRDVSLGFALVVALLVQSLFVEKNGTSREELTLSSSNAGHWMIKTYVLCVVSRGRVAVPVPCSSPAPHSAWPRGSPPGSRPCSGPWPSHGTLCTWPSKFHIKTGLSSSVIYLGPMLEILTWDSNLERRKRQDTDIADDLPALLAADKRDVFVVELVPCCLGLVPIQFVKFLKARWKGSWNAKIVSILLK